MASLKFGKDSLSLPGKLALGALFMVMVAAAYFVFLYGEVEGNISAQEQLRQVKTGELDAANDALAAYNKDLTELERRKQLARQQQKILPDESETPSFLSKLQTAATVSGIKLVSWEPQDEAGEAFYARVPMLLKIQGKFHQIAKFFHGVGQIDRIINMENIAIKADPNDLRARAQSVEASSNPQGDEAVNVEVQCLATAFRALKQTDDGGKKRRRGGKR